MKLDRPEIHGDWTLFHGEAGAAGWKASVRLDFDLSIVGA
jgi:hypothetical protein